jgi:hypothetical protein
MQLHPQNLVGEFRTFGTAGPAYQVLGASLMHNNRPDPWVCVQVLDSGEMVDLPAKQVVLDPKA